MEVQHPAVRKSVNNVLRTLSKIELARKEQEALDTRFAAAALEYQANTLKQYKDALADEFADKTVQEYEDAKHELQVEIDHKVGRAQQLAQLAQKLNTEMQQYNNAYFQQTYSEFINPKATQQQGQKGIVPHDKIRLSELGQEKLGVDLTEDLFFKGVELRNGKHYIYAALRLPISYVKPVNEQPEYVVALADHVLTGTDFAIDCLKANGFKAVRPAPIKVEGGCELQLESKSKEGETQILYLYGGRAHPNRRGWVAAIGNMVIEDRVPSYKLLTGRGVVNNSDWVVAEDPFVKAFGFELLSDPDGIRYKKGGYLLTASKVEGATIYTLYRSGDIVFDYCCASDTYTLLKAIFDNMQAAPLAKSGFDPTAIGFAEIDSDADRAYAKTADSEKLTLLYYRQNTEEYLAGWTLIADHTGSGQQMILATGLEDILDTAEVVNEAVKSYTERPRGDSFPLNDTEEKADTTAFKSRAIILSLIALLFALLVIYIAYIGK